MSYNIQELIQESNKNKLFSTSSLISSYLIPDAKDIFIQYARNAVGNIVGLIIEKELYGLKKFVTAISNNSNIELYHKFINTHQIPEFTLKGYKYYNLSNAMAIDRALIIYIEFLEIVQGKVASVLFDDTTDINVKTIQLREVETEVLKKLSKLKKKEFIDYDDFGFPYNVTPNEYFRSSKEKTIVYDKDELEKVYRRLKFAKSHYTPLVNRYKNDISKYYSKMDSAYYSIIDLSKRIVDSELENLNTKIANHILIMNKEMIMIVESVINSQVTNIRDSLVQDLKVCEYINENFNKNGE